MTARPSRKRQGKRVPPVLRVVASKLARRHRLALQGLCRPKTFSDAKQRQEKGPFWAKKGPFWAFSKSALFPEKMALFGAAFGALFQIQWNPPPGRAMRPIQRAMMTRAGKLLPNDFGDVLKTPDRSWYRHVRGSVALASVSTVDRRLRATIQQPAPPVSDPCHILGNFSRSRWI